MAFSFGNTSDPLQNYLQQMQMAQQNFVGILGGAFSNNTQMPDITLYEPGKSPKVQRVGGTFLSRLREEIDEWHGSILDF